RPAHDQLGPVEGRLRHRQERRDGARLVGDLADAGGGHRHRDRPVGRGLRDLPGRHRRRHRVRRRRRRPPPRQRDPTAGGGRGRGRDAVRDRRRRLQPRHQQALGGAGRGEGWHRLAHRRLGLHRDPGHGVAAARQAAARQPRRAQRGGRRTARAQPRSGRQGGAVQQHRRRLADRHLGQHLPAEARRHRPRRRRRRQGVVLRRPQQALGRRPRAAGLMVVTSDVPPRALRRRGRRGSISGVPAGRGVLAKFTPYLFLLAAVGLLLLLTYLPAANMLWYSLTDWDGLDLDKQFVGLDNYVEVFTNPQIFSVFGVSLYYFVGSFLQMAIALYFAAL